MKQVGSPGAGYQLSAMEARHRKLDDRLEELRGRKHLTPPEQRELAEIKKHKLHAKDQITALRRSS